MLIRALCDYYDALAADGKLLKDGYTEVNLHYLISLKPDGKIAEIIDWQEQIPSGKNGKMVQVPRKVVMPKNPSTTKIFSYIPEYRSKYIFGLTPDKGGVFTETKTEFSDFVKRNLSFVEGMDSPIINAYRNFMTTWIPENEAENEMLKGVSKFGTSNFAFCLDGSPDILLHQDKQLLEKWEQEYSNAEPDSEVVAQCAVTGEREYIARTHDKINGLYSTGSALIGYKGESGCSYGNEQSYNSNISVSAMKKYTEAMNYLLGSKEHHRNIEDIHILYWAAGGIKNEACTDLMSLMMFDQENEKMDAGQVDAMLETIMAGVKNGEAKGALLRSDAFQNIDPGVDFYMVGLKPNTSRLAVKFIDRRKFGDILINTAMHRYDMQIGDKAFSVPLWRLCRELVSPKSTDKTVDASLFSAIFTAIIHGTNYPDYLLSTVIRRLKTDKEIDGYSSRIRTGIIKACLNRKSRLSGQKEEFGLSLDTTNKNQAYLCGRLFAVLEKIQQAASDNKLNRTIKDSYFSSAASKPALIFPNLLKLSQNHLAKLGDKGTIFYSKLIQEIMGKMEGEFPDTLSLSDQGRFMIGYYQQFQSFFEKKETNDDKHEEE